MNPYQSPVPIEEEYCPWQTFLWNASRETFLATLGFALLLIAALALLVVMPVAIGLAWHQYRRSWALMDLFLATAMTAMLPLWKNTFVEMFLDIFHGMIS